MAGTAQVLTLLVATAYHGGTHTTQPQYALLRRKSSRPGEPIQLGMMMMVMVMMMMMMMLMMVMIMMMMMMTMMDDG